MISRALYGISRLVDFSSIYCFLGHEEPAKIQIEFLNVRSRWYAIPTTELFGRHRKRRSMLRITIATVVLTFLSIVAYGESKMVTLDVTELNGETLTLTGILEKPEGNGPFPAVVLLHSCAGIKWLEMQ